MKYFRYGKKRANGGITKEKLKDHFSKLFGEDRRLTEKEKAEQKEERTKKLSVDDAELERRGKSDPENEKLKLQGDKLHKINLALRKLKNGKAAGEDEIAGEFLKNLSVTGKRF